MKKRIVKKWYNYHCNLSTIKYIKYYTNESVDKYMDYCIKRLYQYFPEIEKWSELNNDEFTPINWYKLKKYLGMKNKYEKKNS